MRAIHRPRPNVGRAVTILFRRVELPAPTIGTAGTVLCYGHGGRPVLVFPTGTGRAEDFAGNGMVQEVSDLIGRGQVRLYCVNSYDGSAWSARDLPREERARRHGEYEAWIVTQVAAHIHQDGIGFGEGEIATAGCSTGAVHALNFGLTHAELFPLALCFSGRYDPTRWPAEGEPGGQAPGDNLSAYVENLHGDSLDGLRRRLSVLLVCGHGATPESAGALEQSRAMADRLTAKGIRCELDVRGHDGPPDWPAWRAQFAHHLPRFCSSGGGTPG